MRVLTGCESDQERISGQLQIVEGLLPPDEDEEEETVIDGERGEVWITVGVRYSLVIDRP